MPVRDNDLAMAVVDGELWISRRGTWPQKFVGDPEAVFFSWWFDSAAEAAVVATSGASRFIVEAFDRCGERGIPLSLCGPRVVEGPRIFRCPQAMAAKLSAIRTATGRPPSSVGGPRRMTSLERPIYAAAASLEEGRIDAPELAALEDHPLLRAMKFAPGLRTERVRRIAAAIRDPRWFVNPAKPNAMSPLYAHFGLGGRSLGSRRSAVVMEAPEDQFDPAFDHMDPRCLVFRRHFAFHRAMRDPRSAAAATARFFLRYLRAVWLAILNPDNPDFLSFDHLFESAFTHGAPGDADHARDDLAIEAAAMLGEWVGNIVKQC